jgi:hypothetical protein
MRENQDIDLPDADEDMQREDELDDLFGTTTEEESEGEFDLFGTGHEHVPAQQQQRSSIPDHHPQRSSSSVESPICVSRMTEDICALAEQTMNVLDTYHRFLGQHVGNDLMTLVRAQRK